MYTGNVDATVEAITDLVNTFSTDKIASQFNEKMSMQHRTLQNSFTRLALQWIEHVASDGYRTDPRNESSHQICKQLLAAFRVEMESQGYSQSTLEIMSKPSGGR